MMRSIAAVAGLALLAGCAATQPSGPPAGRQFDGTYVGHTALLRGWGFQCGIPDFPQQIIVRDGRFDYPFQVDPPTVTPVAVPIGADGSFHRSMQYGVFEPLYRRDYRTAWMTIDGRVTGNAIDITESDLRCTRRTTLQRR